MSYNARSSTVGTTSLSETFLHNYPTIELGERAQTSARLDIHSCRVSRPESLFDYKTRDVWNFNGRYFYLYFYLLSFTPESE